MNHVMLDIDGTLIQSYEFDEKCFIDAVREVTGLELETDWENYPYVTDRGILKTFISRQAPRYSLNELERAVKPVFTRNIQKTIDSEPTLEVDGAIEFVSYLRKSKEHVVSVATGGWGETAKLKLESAGFETDGLILASSNDHYSRIEIMKTARRQADLMGQFPVTYFGDAVWDVKACDTLGVNLVVVGERVNHHQRIQNFNSLERALSYVK
ncbi:HAD family hydrolase [Pseudoalteromonas ulvae]|uniref:Haloacid dehalogenase n=1 Tax=Pseudoalteromonas ulvae TaxID=107327 RepID=A0A244CSX3_PSEDV|nr:HAD family hydrolase [Pseudoalteromonas ulvae]OUL58720.1 haloacid dehalogenase [Pseudoalteromonas ulvae]